MPFYRFSPLAAVLALASIASASGCVTLDLREATEPYVGRTRPGAPTIAVAEVKDRRDDQKRFGRVGWNVLSFSGDAGQKFRNALMSALADHGYNLRFVGYKNVLNYEESARAVHYANADVLLTAAVLELRVYSTDPFFDPADIDFIAQVNLLDHEGRTVYTRHVHAHEDKRVWFNPAFGAMGILDELMEEVANYVARDPQLAAAVHAVQAARRSGDRPVRAALAREPRDTRRDETAPVAESAEGGGAIPRPVELKPLGEAGPSASAAAEEARAESQAAEAPAGTADGAPAPEAEERTPSGHERAIGARKHWEKRGRVKVMLPGDVGRIEAGEFDQ